MLHRRISWWREMRDGDLLSQRFDQTAIDAELEGLTRSAIAESAGA